MELAERLKKLWVQRGSPDYQVLARDARISKASVTNYFEKGRMPKADQLAKLASYFGVTMDELFHGREKIEGTSAIHDAPPTDDAEKRRADAAEARLERAKKVLRAALAELESGVKY